MARAAVTLRARAAERASIVAVMAAMALVVLDAGLVNLALPAMAASLAVAPARIVLAVSAYQAALVIGLLPGAHVAEKVGYKRLFVAGLVLFSAASILCGFARTLPLLVAARVLQGLGGAAIMALGIALLRFALGPDRLGRAIGWNALNVALCSAAAPVLAALVLSVAPWPWLFFAKLPVIAIALAASSALPEVAPARASIDRGGIALHAAIVAGFLLAAGSAIERPALAAVAGAVAIAAAAMLVRRERLRGASIWPVDLLARRAFRISVAASVCCFVAQSAGVLALPFYLQLALGRGPLETGAVMACWPLTVAVTSPVASRLAERLGSAVLCVAGGGALAAGLLLSALWPMQASVVPLALGAALSGLGFGLFQVPNNRTMFLSAPPERSAAAGGMQGTARLTGQTLGALATGLLMVAASTALAPRLGLALGAAFAAAAALISAIAIRPARPIPAASRGDIACTG